MVGALVYSLLAFASPRRSRRSSIPRLRWMLDAAPVMRVSVVDYAALVVELTSIVFGMGRAWLAAVRNPEHEH